MVELRKVTSRRPAMPDTHKYKLDLANPHPSRRGEAQEPRLEINGQDFEWER